MGVQSVSNTRHLSVAQRETVYSWLTVAQLRAAHEHAAMPINGRPRKAGLVSSLAAGGPTPASVLMEFSKADLLRIATRAGCGARSSATKASIIATILSVSLERSTTSRARNTDHVAGKRRRSATQRKTKAGSNPGEGRAAGGLRYEDRRLLGAVWACLADGGGVRGKEERLAFRNLCERLQLEPRHRVSLEKYLGERRSPIGFARRIRSGEARVMLLWDLLALNLGTHNYSAQEREGLRRVARALGIPWPNVQEAEDRIAKTLKSDLQRETKAAGTKVARETAGRKWKVAAAALAGGVALAATGGLAAPAIGGAIGTYWMGLSGAVAANAGLAALGGGAVASGGFGMAGGSIAVASLFGAAGAGTAARKAARRTGTLSEFAIPKCKGDGLHVRIGISGFLSAKEDFKDGWWDLWKACPNGELRVVRWEPKALRDLGAVLGSMGGTVATQQVAKYWAKKAGKTAAKALRWPAFAVSALGAIDNPWHVAKDRSEKAGEELAAYLRDREFGHRPVTLVGHSLGARMIVTALAVLGRSGHTDLVHDVVLLGAAINPDADQWRLARAAVAGRLVNAYSTADWVLAWMYRAGQAERSAAGLYPVRVEGVEDVDVRDLVGGHLGYRSALTRVLDRVDLNA